MTAPLTAEERRILRQLEGNLAHARKVGAGWQRLATIVLAAAIQLEVIGL